MANCLTYSLASDFSNEINVAKLACTINDETLTVGFNGIKVESDVVSICFDGTPSGADTTIINNIVSSHDPSIPLDYGDITINFGATGDPGISNDLTETYEPGSLWLNRNDEKVWMNTNNENGMSNWICINCDAKNIIGSSTGLLTDGQTGSFLDFPDPNDGDEWIDPQTGDRFIYNNNTNTWNLAPCCGAVNILGTTGGTVSDGQAGGIPERPFPSYGDEWVDPITADRFIYNGTIWELTPFPDIEQLANVGETGAGTGDILRYNGNNWEIVDLCSTMNDPINGISIDCLNDVEVGVGGATGGVLFFDGSNWVNSTGPAGGEGLIYNEVTGQWEPSLGFIGEMLFLGNTAIDTSPNLRSITDTLTTLANFQAVVGLTGGFLNNFEFDPKIGATPGFLTSGETGDGLRAEVGGTYLTNYSLTIETSNNTDLFFALFINNEVIFKSVSRSLTSGNKKVLLSNQFFLPIQENDRIDFRLDVQGGGADVTVIIYHLNLNLSRKQ